MVSTSVLHAGEFTTSIGQGRKWVTGGIKEEKKNFKEIKKKSNMADINKW